MKVEEKLINSKKYPTFATLIKLALDQDKTVEMEKADYGFDFVIDDVKITTTHSDGVLIPEIFEGHQLYKRRDRRNSFVDRLTDEAKDKIKEIDNQQTQSDD